LQGKQDIIQYTAAAGKAKDGGGGSMTPETSYGLFMVGLWLFSIYAANIIFRRRA
jgi:hypothetical protein